MHLPKNGACLAWNDVNVWQKWDVARELKTQAAIRSTWLPRILSWPLLTWRGSGSTLSSLQMSELLTQSIWLSQVTLWRRFIGCLYQHLFWTMQTQKTNKKKTITLQIWCTFQIAILTYDIPINQICKLKCIKIKWAAKETYIFCSFVWVSSLINDIIFTIGLSQQLTRSPDLFVICYILESQVVT